MAKGGLGHGNAISLVSSWPYLHPFSICEPEWHFYSINVISVSQLPPNDFSNGMASCNQNTTPGPHHDPQGPAGSGPAWYSIPLIIGFLLSFGTNQTHSSRWVWSSLFPQPECSALSDSLSSFIVLAQMAWHPSWGLGKEVASEHQENLSSIGAVLEISSPHRSLVHYSVYFLWSRHYLKLPNFLLLSGPHCLMPLECLV